MVHVHVFGTIVVVDGVHVIGVIGVGCCEVQVVVTVALWWCCLYYYRMVQV